MKKDGLQSITLPFAEHSTLALGEEATTEALGEESPSTTPSEEGIASLQYEGTAIGGPFGSF